MRMVILMAGIALVAPALARSDPPAAPPAAAEAPLTKLPYSPSLDVSSMDRSADACKDLYQYACGGWVSHNPIPADQASWSVYGKLYQDNQQYLWGILQTLTPAVQRTPNQQKIGDYFAACMDASAAEERGSAPLEPLLAAIDAIESKDRLPALLAELRLRTDSEGFLFAFGANQDFADSSRIIGFAQAGGLGMPDRDYYLDADAHAVALQKKYHDHVTRTFMLLGDRATTASRNAEIVLRLETPLARASLTRVELRDPYKLYHTFDRAGLAQLTPHFDWPAYLRVLSVDGAINVTEPKFFAETDRLITSTSLADIKTYLRWQLAHALSPYLSAKFENERFDFFDHELRGVPLHKPRWKRCVGYIGRQLGEALGQEFVARTFGPELKSATRTMVQQIETAMRQDLSQLEWMSDATKHQALAKLDAVVNKIGYPDRWRDYSAVVIRPDDFVGNVLRAAEGESRRELAKIGKPVDRAEWEMTPQTVDAYYDPQMNDINFPAAVLQPPLYDPAMDDAPNYGNTGGTVGHELTHGFDDEGRQFDAAGNLTDWWGAADAKEFEQRTRCIVDQYAGYVVIDEVHINSKLTLGEDVADLGGLILAHMAWRVQTAGKTLAARDGLTPEQRFFVGYAQWACENVRPETQRLRAKTDPHSPGRYRVNGLVVNMPEFRQAFACPVTAPMAKQNPCRVW